MSEDRVATLMQIVSLINHRDLDAAAGFVTPDFVRHDLARAIQARGNGPDEVTDFLGTMIEALPDLRFEIKDAVQSGDKLAMRYEISGTHDGPIFDSEPTGAKVGFSGINIYRFEGDQIAEVWQLWDWAGFLSQIGALDVFADRSG